jgi:voltage-gated potassium channel
MPPPPSQTGLRFGLGVLIATIVVAVLGYRSFGYSWVDALYMVAITLSTIGYGEHSEASPVQKLFTIGVIVVGLGAAGYTLTTLAQAIFGGEIERLLGHQRMKREIDQLTNHTIVCGYGRIGAILAADLARHQRRFVVLERSPERAEQARDKGYLVLQGDATDDETLNSAGAQRAYALITALPNDAANVFITLTARNLNSKLQVIARAEHTSSEKKLRQAGANRVVLPALIGAQQMVRMITRPSTADLMDLIRDEANLDLELDEVTITANSKLAGTSVQESEAHREHHLLVLAVKQATGNMIFHPAADYRFAAGDVAIVLGDAGKIARFRMQYTQASPEEK